MAFEVVVLGSGGAVPGPRAPSAYLVRAHDELVLVDVGASALGRLVELGVSPRHLSLVAVTHGHLDHSGGLAPLLFAAWMDGRDHPMPVSGPEGRGPHPGIGHICERLFGVDGAWPYLREFEGFGVDVREVGAELADARPQAVWSGEQLAVSALPVPHGAMPALAYRIDGPGGSVCFTGDISGTDAGLIALARGADLLVHDQAIAHRTADPKGNHPVPEDTAANAAGAGVAHLLLSHLTPDSDDHLAEVLERVRASYDGEVTVAEDRLSIPIGVG